MELELSDTDALARAAQGDSEAFGILYDRYIGRIYNYIYYRTGNHQDAEDLTSRVFTRAMNDGPQVITRRGEEAILVSRADYEKHVAAPPKKMSLGEYLLKAPKVEGLVIERDRSEGREVDFGPDEE